jgi:hypothetical protein
MATSIRMAASKTKTITEALLVLPTALQLCRQALRVLFISGLRLRGGCEKSTKRDRS